MILIIGVVLPAKTKAPVRAPWRVQFSVGVDVGSGLVVPFSGIGELGVEVDLEVVVIVLGDDLFEFEDLLFSPVGRVSGFSGQFDHWSLLG